MKMDARFKKNMRGVFEKYEFEVGILQDKAYRIPMRGQIGQKGQDVLTKFAGATVRKASRRNSGKNISDISAANRKRYNYLVKPFRQKNTDIQRLMKRFFDFAFGRTTEKRLENSLQAIVRNPILSKKYGSNSSLTKKIKGFNHVMMDTAQLFKSIKARVRKKGQ
jgi:hypothetical protein